MAWVLGNVLVTTLNGLQPCTDKMLVHDAIVANRQSWDLLASIHAELESTESATETLPMRGALTRLRQADTYAAVGYKGTLENNAEGYGRDKRKYGGQHGAGVSINAGSSCDAEVSEREQAVIHGASHNHSDESMQTPLHVG